MSTPRSFYGAEVCPGAPMPASRPPGTLGICHTCDHFCTVRKPTIQRALLAAQRVEIRNEHLDQIRAALGASMD